MEHHSVQVEIDLTDQQAAALRALGDKPLPNALHDLATVASTEWLEWLVADDRPASLTEVSKRRVRALVETQLLPQMPTAPVIARRVRLTLGQARYIVASLAFENPQASDATRDELARRLREVLGHEGIPTNPTAEQMEELKNKEDDVRFDATRREGDLASEVHDELLNARSADRGQLWIDEFQPPTITRKTASYVRLKIRPHVSVSILRALQRAGAR